MANRLFNPNDQYCNTTGVPLNGGKLYFYASGTSTPLNTYTDRALSVANANPVVLNSAGRLDNPIFLQNLAYKVVLKDSSDNTIWTEDPVYASDFSADAQFLTYAGNPNGNVAGTAGSGTTQSSVIWDRTNSILYVCTTTGSASTAVWTAVNPSGSATTDALPEPQGYLTPTSGTPIITSDSSAATAILYTPYRGNRSLIYNGSSFVIFTFSELTLTLVAAHASSTIYDVFMFSNSGAATLATGPGWTNSGAGTGSRGTGAGTTELTRIGGIMVNAVAITGRNGSTTYSIAANQATYLGSIFIDSSAGQVTQHVSYGQSRKWGVWNAYNKSLIELIGGDATASWAGAGGSIRNSNNDANNKLTSFCGLPEEKIFITFTQKIATAAASATQRGLIHIGINNTTSAGKQGVVTSAPAATTVTVEGDAYAEHTVQPGIGINTINMLETGSAANTYSGTQTNMRCKAIWRG